MSDQQQQQQQQQLQEFAHLLHVLMSANNEQRKAGEAHFQAQLSAHSEQAVHLLLALYANHQADPVLRLFSAVLLRRAVEQYTPGWAPSAVEALKSRVLLAWQQEHNAHLAQKMSHVLGEICLKHDWEDLLPQVVAHARTHQHHTTLSHNTHNTASLLYAVRLVETLCEYIPGDITTHFQLLGEFLSPLLNDTNNNNSNTVAEKALRFSTAKAVAACVAVFESDTARNAFSQALPALLAVLHSALSQGDEQDATSLMEHLVSVAQEQPLFFKPHCEALTHAMLTVAQVHAQTHTLSLELSTRTMALEVLVTLCESAPAMLRRVAQGSAVARLLDLALAWMLSVDEDEQRWQCGNYHESSEDDDEAEEEEEARVGEEALERIVAGLGGKTVSEHLRTRVRDVLVAQTHTDWRHRRAAVSALCRFAEGAPKHFSKFLESAVPLLANALRDSSVRVRYEAIQTIGRLAAIFPDNCDELVDTFLPALATTLHDAQSCARVRGHAASALINLLHPEHCGAETLTKFVPPLLEALLAALQTAPFAVRAPCLVVVGCVAQICPEQFSSFYDRFMPGIKSLLHEATAPELLTLRGKAMECAGLIGEAVGAQTFAKDALEIMHIFAHVMHQDVDQDVTFEYILPACARIAKALRAQFVEFVPLVCEPLLAGARKEVNFSVVDAGDDEAEGEVVNDDETGVQSTVVSFGAGVKKRVSINTHAVHQRVQAARVIFELADALGALLGAYLLPALDVLLAMTADPHSNNVRSSAAAALPRVFSALLTTTRTPTTTATGSTQRAEADLQQVFVSIADKLVAAMKAEPDMNTRSVQAESVRDLLSSVYLSGEESEDGLRRAGFAVHCSDEVAYNISAGALLLCADYVVSRSEKERTLERNEGLDEEDREAQHEEMEEQDEHLATLMDVFAHLLKLQGERYMPLFDRLVAPSFSSYLLPGQPEFLQVLATSLIDDALEFGGASAHKYLASAAPVLLANTQQEESPTLRQCSLYGLAVAARVAPATVLAQSLVGPLLSCLVSAVLRPDSMEEDLRGATENALFGLGNLLAEREYRAAILSLGTTFPPQELAKLWLGKLPLRMDEMEAKASTKNLLDLWERRDELLFPAEGESPFLAEVVRIFAECLLSFSTGEKNASTNTDEDGEVVVAHRVSVERIRASLSQLQGSQTAQSVVARLPVHLQQALS